MNKSGTISIGEPILVIPTTEEELIAWVEGYKMKYQASDSYMSGVNDALYMIGRKLMEQNKVPNLTFTVMGSNIDGAIAVPAYGRLEQFPDDLIRNNQDDVGKLEIKTGNLKHIKLVQPAPLCINCEKPLIKIPNDDYFECKNRECLAYKKEIKEYV